MKPKTKCIKCSTCGHIRKEHACGRGEGKGCFHYYFCKCRGYTTVKIKNKAKK